MIGGLYRRTKPLLIANLGAISLLTVALWNTADRLHLVTWSVVLALWTLLRFVLARLYLRRTRASHEARRWTIAFAIGSGVAGALWGSSILLVTSLEADSAKLVVAFVMAALSAAAIAGYTNSLMAFAAFICPALVPFAIKLIWLDGTLHPMIAAFVLFWGWLLWAMARHLNQGFKEGIALNLQNRGLVRDLICARDKAEAASSAKTRFLANMSHELRTPLNAIIGYSEMMTGQVLGPIGNPRYEPYVRHIHDSGSILLNIVDQVLDISELETGQVNLTEKAIDLTELIAGTVDQVNPSAVQDEIAVSLAIAPNLPRLRGDPARIRQMLLNLLSNAVKFTLPQGCVEVAAAQEDDGTLLIRVTDTGIGIPHENLQQITTAFAQLENKNHLQRVRALKRDVGQTSTGLGLPLVKRFADLHGASFELESQLDHGTTARLRFPKERVMERSTAVTEEGTEIPSLPQQAPHRGAI